jgi:hypothetical protein
MNGKRIQLMLTGVAAWISLLLMIATTYGAGIVIGGNYTDIGTIVVISPKPGDTPQDSGTALLNNLAAITPDVNNPYVIKLGPGIYDTGTNSLQMKQYVDLEGSGENTTIITGHIDSGTSGVVQGVNNTEIRFLTVKNTGGGSVAVAIYNASASPKITNVTTFSSGGSENYAVFNDSSSPTMTNVTASASGGSGSLNGGVLNLASSPTMTNVTASASGEATNFGVYNISSFPTMTNVTASASGGSDTNLGVYNSSGTTMIHNSIIKGSTHTIYTDVDAITRVGNTKLDGGAVHNAGTLTCVGAYNETYVALGTNCQ